MRDYVLAPSWAFNSHGALPRMYGHATCVTAPPAKGHHTHFKYQAQPARPLSSTTWPHPARRPARKARSSPQTTMPSHGDPPAPPPLELPAQGEYTAAPQAPAGSGMPPLRLPPTAVSLMLATGGAA